MTSRVATKREIAFIGVPKTSKPLACLDRRAARLKAENRMPTREQYEAVLTEVQPRIEPKKGM